MLSFKNAIEQGKKKQKKNQCLNLPAPNHQQGLPPNQMQFQNQNPFHSQFQNQGYQYAYQGQYPHSNQIDQFSSSLGNPFHNIPTNQYMNNNNQFPVYEPFPNQDQDHGHNQNQNQGLFQNPNQYYANNLNNDPTSNGNHINWMMLNKDDNFKRRASYNDININNELRKQLNTRSHFTKEEDERLKIIVEEENRMSKGKINWTAVCSHMEGRTDRQCRERYMNYLVKPLAHKGNWTKEENELLLKKVAEFGPNWVRIEQFFEGRSNIILKNHYNCLVRPKNGHSSEIQHESANVDAEVNSNSSSNHSPNSPKSLSPPPPPINTQPMMAPVADFRLPAKKRSPSPTPDPTLNPNYNLNVEINNNSNNNGNSNNINNGIVTNTDNGNNHYGNIDIDENSNEQDYFNNETFLEPDFFQDDANNNEFLFDNNSFDF